MRLSLGAGAAYLGDGEIIPDKQKQWVGIGHLGFQIPVHPRVEFHMQIDAHTDVIDTANPLAAEGGLLGTLGGRVGIGPNAWLDLAIIEDLDNEASSDVVFQIHLGWRH